MNNKAIFEIGDIIHVKNSLKGKKLTAKNIIKSYDFQMFRKEYPELVELVLGK